MNTHSATSVTLSTNFAEKKREMECVLVRYVLEGIVSGFGVERDSGLLTLHRLDVSALFPPADSHFVQMPYLRACPLHLNLHNGVFCFMVEILMYIQCDNLMWITNFTYTQET